MPYRLNLSRSRVDRLPENRSVVDPVLHLNRVRLSGDYDRWGNYWGNSAKVGSVYIAEGEHENETILLSVRAHNRESAKIAIRAILPNARFCR